MKCLDKVKNALLTVSDNVGHYEAFRKNDMYIVWAEDGEGSQINGDNVMQGQSIQGRIDYFTKKENDLKVQEIQKALRAARISFYLDSIQYEDETKYIHYSWIFEVS